jgi:broad specificity phosphatase PhoE
MHLTLIRHAESNHIQSGMISGKKSCTGLTPEGFSQAHRLADRFRVTGDHIGCQVFLTSPVLRARQTAEIIAQALPVGTPIPDSDLVEQIPGDADGLTHQEFRELYGDFNPEIEPKRPFPPNGESWMGFVERVNCTLERLATQYAGQHVIAVTHAGFIVVAFMVLFHLPPSGSRAWIDPLNTSLTEWVKDKGIWHLLSYNDTWHLPPK